MHITRVQQVQAVQRNHHADAIGAVARLKPVAQREGMACGHQNIGPVILIGRARIGPDQVVRRQQQRARIGLVGLAQPALKRPGAADLRWKPLIEKAEQCAVIHQHVAGALLVLFCLQLPLERGIGAQEFKRLLNIAGYHGVPDKYPPGFREINRSVTHAAFLDQDQSKQAYLLVGHDLAASARPPGIEVPALEQVTAHALDPFSLDLRVDPRVRTARLDDFGRHQPFG